MKLVPSPIKTLFTTFTWTWRGRNHRGTAHRAPSKKEFDCVKACSSHRVFCEYLIKNMGNMGWTHYRFCNLLSWLNDVKKYGYGPDRIQPVWSVFFFLFFFMSSVVCISVRHQNGFPVVVFFFLCFSIILSLYPSALMTLRRRGFWGPVDWEDDHDADHLLKLWEVVL